MECLLRMTCGSFKAVCHQPEVESDRDFENIIVVWRWGKNLFEWRKIRWGKRKNHGWDLKPLFTVATWACGESQWATAPCLRSDGWGSHPRASVNHCWSSVPKLHTSSVQGNHSFLQLLGLQTIWRSSGKRQWDSTQNHQDKGIRNWHYRSAVSHLWDRLSSDPEHWRPPALRKAVGADPTEKKTLWLTTSCPQTPTGHGAILCVACILPFAFAFSYVSKQRYNE